MKTVPSRRTITHTFKETSRVDPYRSQCKPPGVMHCPDCQSTYVRGRWLSPQRPKPARRSNSTAPETTLSSSRSSSAAKGTTPKICPACKQSKDHYALGVLEIQGKKWEEKKDLILNTLKQSEARARFRNDQQRILWTQSFKNITKIYVSLPELARRMGRQLEKSFQGVAEYIRSSEEPYLRVRWWSDLPHIAHRIGAPFAVKRKSRS